MIIDTDKLGDVIIGSSGESQSRIFAGLYYLKEITSGDQVILQFRQRNKDHYWKLIEVIIPKEAVLQDRKNV